MALKGWSKIHWSSSFPSPNFEFCLLLMFSPWLYELNWYFIVILLGSLPSSGLWNRLGKDGKLHYRAGKNTSVTQQRPDLQGSFSTGIRTPLPTRLNSGQSWQFDMGMLFPLTQPMCCHPDQSSPHTATFAVGGCASCQGLSCVGTTKVQSSWEGKPGGGAGLDWILWHVINADCKQWSLTCFWGKSPCPLKAANISPSLQVLMLLGKPITT